MIPCEARRQATTPNVLRLPGESFHGQNYSGTSDFSFTATLAGIQVVDAAGNPVSGWTVTSGSGTVYPKITPAATPEPGVTTFLLATGIPASLLAIRRRRRKSR